jgi:glycosyltransferase involved in cell wall biosynthesis
MKVLLNCHVPFMLAHGGAQIQIEQTWAALNKAGVEVESLRWWDDKQTGDILHHFGRLPAPTLQLAQKKGMKVVLSDLLTEHGSRSRIRHLFHKIMIRTMGQVLPRSFTLSFSWDSYRMADACLALTPVEADLMKELFGAAANRVHVVPNGVEDVFLENRTAERGKWLVCTATITERKRVVELAEAAAAAQTPLWVVGKPYSDTDLYADRFREVLRAHPAALRYEGPVTERSRMAEIYREARGFVLLSTMESLSLSALEAAACGCPLLLSDLPWARTSFKQDARYCPIASTSRTAQALRMFYDAAPSLKPPPKPMTWLDVGRQIKGIYEGRLAQGGS